MPGKTPKRTLPMPADWIERQRTLYEVLASSPEYPSGRFEGRGIVTCAGGKYFPPAWVMMNMLRRSGCELPIQMWYLGPDEINKSIREAVKQIPNVELVDAYAEKVKHPVRKLGGWESKPFSIINCPFEEVLFLDGDNVPVKNPEFLFEHPKYKKYHSIFWPDYERLGNDRSIWQICKIAPRSEPEFETGQILINKKECWKALLLTMHMNEWSEFYYNHIWGDKETFHLAWHVANKSYYMIPHPIERIPKTMCQHAPEGERLFQHRNLAKFQIFGNEHIPGFMFEDECLNLIAELSPLGFGEGFPVTFNAIGKSAIPETAKRNIFSASMSKAYKMLLKDRYYKYKREGSSNKILEFKEDGTFGKGSSPEEYRWYLGLDTDAITLFILDINRKVLCKLRKLSDARWKGCLIGQVRYNVEIHRK